MKPDTFFTILMGILFVVFFLTIYAFYRIGYNKGVDEQTKALCRIYASQDHSGEIGKERLEKMGYLWKNFNWEQSCLKNSGK